MSASPPRGRDAGAESAEAPSAGSQPELEELSGHRIALLRAPNPGPLTLSGTNSWLVGREPAWVVDPGPLLDTHIERLLAAIDARGGLGGVVLTHDHHDHSEAVQTLLAERPAPLAGGRGDVDVMLTDDLRFGPFHALATPGHARDHFALVAEGGCFTGDAVLGDGSVFISPYPGAMSAYVLALERLRAREDFDVLCPGHGPPVWDPQSKLDEYIGHRIDREKRLIAALADGNRTIAALLDTAWPEVPEALRPLATATLAAHLDKLAEEGVLPAGVERPMFEGVVW
jgi:glyoxylase-like metal-dependent hydrolase (beta-lactamase superfamily II)